MYLQQNRERSKMLRFVIRLPVKRLDGTPVHHPPSLCAFHPIANLLRCSPFSTPLIPVYHRTAAPLLQRQGVGLRTERGM